LQLKRKADKYRANKKIFVNTESVSISENDLDYNYLKESFSKIIRESPIKLLNMKKAIGPVINPIKEHR